MVELLWVLDVEGCPQRFGRRCRAGSFLFMDGWFKFRPLQTLNTLNPKPLNP